MNMAIAHDVENREIINTALEQYPYSFLLRAAYLTNLKPRWGGSYSEMNSFADAAQKYVKINPRLAALKGFSYLDHANYITGGDNLTPISENWS